MHKYNRYIILASSINFLEQIIFKICMYGIYTVGKIVSIVLYNIYMISESVSIE